MACLKISCVKAEIAATARDELLAQIRDSRQDLMTDTFERPFIQVAHTVMTTQIAEECKAAGRHHAAQILKVSSYQVEVFRPPIAVVYVRFQSSSAQSAAKTISGKVVAILALGDLDLDKGLPRIGSDTKYHKVDSGEVLYASGEDPQYFNPSLAEPGFAILTIWSPKLA